MKGWGLASAFRTLTIIPLWGKESTSPATALYWFVPVGAFLGAIISLAGYTSVALSLPFVGAALIVTLQVILTRAFHLDGLADTADGFYGGWTAERRLAIMKDSHIGAFGVIAVVLALVGKIAAIASVLDSGRWELLFFIPVLSRALLVFQSVCNPYARKEGGTASRLVTESHARHILVTVLWVVLIVILGGLPQWIPLVCMAGTGILATCWIARTGRRYIGGITGDVLGATVELSELVMAGVLAVFLALPI
jgi:adenosylcobinamide-GDP ribazoletransferase